MKVLLNQNLLDGEIGVFHTVVDLHQLGVFHHHEKLPSGQREVAGVEIDVEGGGVVADRCGVSLTATRSRLEELRAGNSKLGLRGVRWVLDDVQLFAALSRGVFEAAVEVAETLDSEARVSLLLGAVSFPAKSRQLGPNSSGCARRSRWISGALWLSATGWESRRPAASWR